MSQRLAYIDIAKGFAILAMLFGHTAPGDDVNTWIFIFHMPLFFIVGGILLFYRTGGCFLSCVGLKQLFKNRCQNLLKPYIIFCLFLCFFYTILSYIGGDGFPIQYYIRTVTFLGVDSLWFIPCYFWSEMLFCYFLTKKKGTMFIFILCLIGISLMAFPSPNNDYLLYSSKIVTSFSFFSAGYYIMKYRLVSKLNCFFSLFLLFFCSVLGEMAGFSAIGGPYPYYCLYYILAVLMTISILYLFSMKSNLFKFFSKWGKYSIVVLCTNNILIESIRLLDHLISNDFLFKIGMLGNIIFFVVLYVLEYFIIELAKTTNLGCFFGIKKVSV